MKFPFTITPEMLQKGLTGLGIAAGQLKQNPLDDEAKELLRDFALRAFASGDATAYVKDALRYVEARDRPPAPSTTRATARVVGSVEVLGDTRKRGSR